jgi:RNA methyltransferase, TrmH family
VTSPEIQYVSSANNAMLKDLRRLVQDNTAYRKQGRIWLEGDHLCRAALARGVKPEFAVYAESFWQSAAAEWSHQAPRSIVVADAMFASLSSLESPARMGFAVPLPAQPEIQPQAATVVLDRVQDAGNVGSILRCASAFGFRQVIAIKGAAAFWSQKVLRAGMGAHFGLALVEAADEGALEALRVPIITTSSHGGELLHRVQLPWPCAWALGHEGQGVSDGIARRAAFSVRIAQPGGEESLNVAAAAAICLPASAATHAA